MLWSGAAQAAICDQAPFDPTFGLGAMVPHPNLTWGAILPLVGALFLFLMSYALIRERWLAAVAVAILGTFAINNGITWYFDPTGLAAIAHAEGCRASPVVVSGLTFVGAAVLVLWRPKGPPPTTPTDS